MENWRRCLYLVDKEIIPHKRCYTKWSADEQMGNGQGRESIPTIGENRGCFELVAVQQVRGGKTCNNLMGGGGIGRRKKGSPSYDEAMTHTWCKSMSAHPVRGERKVK